MRRFVFLAVIPLLFASCSQERTENSTSGTPVEVSLSFSLADVEYPPVSVSTSAALPSAIKSASSMESAPLQVDYTTPAKTTSLRSASLTNVWVLQFDSLGSIGVAGNCVAAKYIGTVTSGDNLNPTLITGTNQVIYIIANGPAAGSIATDTYTLETFKNAAYFSGSIMSDATAPYIGRIAGGATVEANGEMTSAMSVPTVTLYRIAAKVSLTLHFAVTGYTLSSVQMFNAPTYMYYLNGTGVTSFPATPSAGSITTTARVANMTPSTASNGTYTWYVGENKRGTSSTVTSAYLKDFLHVPAGDSYYYCSYIRIQARKNDSTAVMNYYLYLGENATTDFNVRRNWDYTLKAVIQGDATAQESYMGIDGRIRMATSNCYMVAPGGTVTIPVNVKGNGNQPIQADYLANTGLSVTHTVASVGVLWQTEKSLLAVSNFNATAQTVKIETSTAAGNGVVAAYNSSGQILWSWHIWVSKYVPNNGGTTFSYNNGTYTTKFMDRNLGAVSSNAGNVGTMGVLYQWGRKDPTPGGRSYTEDLVDSIYNASNTLLVEGTTGIVAEQVTTIGSNLANTILYPMKNYFGTVDNSYDWYSITAATHNFSLWGAPSTAAPTCKTIFDPCPYGWRVPAYKNGISPLSGLTVSNGTYNKGWDWTSLGAGYFPNTGVRYFNTGLYSNSTNGFYDYASVTASNATGIYFAPTLVNSPGSHMFGHAVAIRCVKE
jgi:hypothetical protein